MNELLRIHNRRRILRLTVDIYNRAHGYATWDENRCVWESYERNCEG